MQQDGHATRRACNKKGMQQEWNATRMDAAGKACSKKGHATRIECNKKGMQQERNGTRVVCSNACLLIRREYGECFRHHADVRAIKNKEPLELRV
jgi:hypothetical protein